MIKCSSQEEFNKKFEYAVNQSLTSWKMIKEVIDTYPEYFNEYAATHDYKLYIHKKSKCDGCILNDGVPHSQCWSCDD